MSLDLTLLRMLRHRDKFNRLIRAVPKAALEARTQMVLDDYATFYKEFPDVSEITHDVFFPWFKGFAHPKAKPETIATMKELIKQIDAPVDQSIEAGIMPRLLATAKAYDIAALLGKFQDGEEVNLYADMRRIMDGYDSDMASKVKVPWVTTSIEELLEEEKNDSGLHWRWDCLNASMRPLRGGDLVIMAGRPDKGKTTALTDNLTFIAPQVQSMYGDTRHILWFNNEGPGKRIIQRVYQSALNATVQDLVTLGGKPSTKGKRNLLREKYDDSVGGRWDIIKVLDIHDMWSHEVEDIIRKLPPALIVFDMIDNIKFGGAAGNNGQRTDQLLEAMYQWARVLAVKHDVPIIATSQISFDGDGQQFPTLGQLKDSKTGKQGAAEAIITIGSVNDIILENSRWINTTKNKLHRNGGPKSPRCEMILDGQRGRYVMPGES